MKIHFWSKSINSVEKRRSWRLHQSLICSFKGCSGSLRRIDLLRSWLFIGLQRRESIKWLWSVYVLWSIDFWRSIWVTRITLKIRFLRSFKHTWILSYWAWLSIWFLPFTLIKICCKIQYIVFFNPYITLRLLLL